MIITVKSVVKHLWCRLCVHFKNWHFVHHGFFSWTFAFRNIAIRTYIPGSPVVKKKICLPMQGTQVQYLVWEDTTYRRATKLVCHNYRACALEPGNHHYWGHTLEPTGWNCWSPSALEPVLSNKRCLHSKKPVHRNQRVVLTHPNWRKAWEQQ